MYEKHDLLKCRLYRRWALMGPCLSGPRLCWEEGKNVLDLPE